MDNNAERLIAALAPDIDKKCMEIQEAKKERKHSRLFFILCAFVMIVPTLFVLLGINLIYIIVPVIFLSAAMLILSPILINQQSETAKVQTT